MSTHQFPHPLPPNSHPGWLLFQQISTHTCRSWKIYDFASNWTEKFTYLPQTYIWPNRFSTNPRAAGLPLSIVSSLMKSRRFEHNLNSIRDGRNVHSDSTLNSIRTEKYIYIPAAIICPNRFSNPGLRLLSSSSLRPVSKASYMTNANSRTTCKKLR